MGSGYPFDQRLVTHISRGLDGDFIVARANEIMSLIRSKGGKTAQSRWLWYQQHQKEIFRDIAFFHGHDKDEIAAQNLLFEQLKLEVQGKPLDFIQVSKYKDEIHGEALLAGHGSEEKALSWLQEERKKRIDFANVPDLDFAQEYLRAWGLAEKELSFSIFNRSKASSSQVSESFDTIWGTISQIEIATSIPNWTQRNGYKGDNFEVDNVSENSITFNVPNAKYKQVVPKRDFVALWKIWSGYKAGTIKRHELRSLSRYTKYIISVFKHLEDHN